jgi:hypothetical protein
MRPCSRSATCSMPCDLTNCDVLIMVANTDFSMLCHVLSLREGEQWNTIAGNSQEKKAPGVSPTAHADYASLEHHVPGHDEETNGKKRQLAIA